MNLKIVTECTDVDWQAIADMLKKLGFGSLKTGMAVFTNPETMKKFTK